MNGLRLFLLPFSFIWAFVTELRNSLYDSGVIKSNKAKIPSIVVGNLSVGGTGKSPHSLLVAKIASSLCKTAILSRGYGRKTKGFIIASEKSLPEEIGDEPCMLKSEAPEFTVAVCENRLVGINNLADENLAECVVLDDAFQHRSLKASCYILLTRFDYPFFWDTVLPAGTLRELPSNAKRADLIIVTKCPETEEFSQRVPHYKKLIAHYTKAPVLFSCYKYKELPKQKDIILVTALANSSDIVRVLKANGKNVKHLKFADHKHFTANDISNIEKEFLSLQGQDKIVLTTDKDFVKLKGRLSCPVFSLKIEVELLHDDNLELEKIIKKSIKLC